MWEAIRGSVKKFRGKADRHDTSFRASHDAKCVLSSFYASKIVSCLVNVFH